MTAARPASASPAPWIAFALGSLAIVLGSRAVAASAPFRARPALQGA